MTQPNVNVKISFFRFFAPIYDYLHFSRKGKTLKILLENNILNSTDIVLDLAGGTGRVAIEIKNYVQQVEVVDASPEMLEKCQEKNLSCHLGYAEKIPFPNNYFDKILIIDAWHHFQNIDLALPEIKRVLKSTGIIFIEEVNPQSFWGRMLKLGEKLLLMKSHFYLPDELQKTVERYFIEVKNIPINKVFYGIIAKK